VTVRKLHLLGSPVLRQRSLEVTTTVDEEVRQLVDDLFETMRAARGVGLAANQVGVARRVAVVDVGEEDPPPLVLVNPVIKERRGTLVAEEGCLSIPDTFGDVERAETVVLEATDRDGRPYTVTATGFKARAIQHEIDHLDGVLFIDHLSAVKRGLLLAKWKKARRGKRGYLKEVTPEPAGEL
jgi:peptide deformylase